MGWQMCLPYSNSKLGFSGSTAGCNSHILQALPCLVAPVKIMLLAEAETHFWLWHLVFFTFTALNLQMYAAFGGLKFTSECFCTFLDATYHTELACHFPPFSLIYHMNVKPTADCIHHHQGHCDATAARKEFHCALIVFALKACMHLSITAFVLCCNSGK